MDILVPNDIVHKDHQGYYIGRCPNCGCDISCNEMDYNNHIIQCCPTCDSEVCFNPIELDSL